MREVEVISDEADESRCPVRRIILVVDDKTGVHGFSEEFLQHLAESGITPEDYVRQWTMGEVEPVIPEDQSDTS